MAAGSGFVLHCEALLDSASEKASTLEQHNTSLGGQGLRDVLEAQRKAEARSSEAEAVTASRKGTCP